jgi:hypothetical protein
MKREPASEEGDSQKKEKEMKTSQKSGTKSPDVPIDPHTESPLLPRQQVGDIYKLSMYNQYLERVLKESRVFFTRSRPFKRNRLHYSYRGANR